MVPVSPCLPLVETVEWFDNLNPVLRQTWHPVCSLNELDAANGLLAVTAFGEPWVVCRLDGRIAVLFDECPHRRAPLSKGRIVDSHLQCGYHGYTFDCTGKCVRIPALAGDFVPPARASVRAAQVELRYGLVWFCVGESLTPLPFVAEFDDPSFVAVAMLPQTWRTSAPQLADNFLDVAHFPFVHAASIGDPTDEHVASQQIIRDGWTATTVHRHRAKSLADAEQASREGTPTYVMSERVMTLTCIAPYHVHLRLAYTRDDVVIAITFFHLPIDLDHTRLYVHVLRNDIADGRATPDTTAEFQLRVSAEDKDVLEAIRARGVALGAGEFHTRADRATIELRRLLADLVVAGRSREKGQT